MDSFSLCVNVCRITPSKSSLIAGAKLLDGARPLDFPSLSFSLSLFSLNLTNSLNDLQLQGFFCLYLLVQFVHLTYLHFPPNINWGFLLTDWTRPTLDISQSFQPHLMVFIFVINKCCEQCLEALDNLQ